MARILVIDDDASLLQMMSLMLKRAGHEPILANNGHKGVEIAREDPPDLAIVDVMMPEINGYEVCQILRQDPATREIPLLVLTALSQPEQHELAHEAGADDFVTKPVTRDDLVSHVDELLATGAQNIPNMPPIPQQVAKPASQQQAQPQQPAGTLPLTAVIGVNRGVGTTVVAVNLSVALGQATRTCLVDLNTQGGHAAIHLQMTPPRATWHDLLNLAVGSDKRQIGSALMLDKALGVALLAAPTQPVNEELPGDALNYVLNVLAEGFRQLVADLPPLLNTMTVETLYNAANIVVVIGDDPVNLVTASAFINDIYELELPGQVHLVLNHTRPHGVSSEDVIATIDQPLAANIPYEPSQVQAIIQGQPLVLTQPNTLFARTLKQFTRQL